MMNSATTVTEKPTAAQPARTFAHATPATAPLVAGRRAFFKYRDLGVTASRNGQMRAQVMSAVATRVRMKFGLYSSIANPPRGEHLDRCIDEVIAEAQLAEACGFDSCFFGEHHQDGDGFLPSPLIVATAVAVRTQRLRLGTSVILLPLHHPVHVAEDAITLDLVSRGRLILGVGIGYQPGDFCAFSVPMELRMGLFEESVELLSQC